MLENFPCFRDVADLEGRRVAFLKRVQILVADIWGCFAGTGVGAFSDIDQLTMFADYRVPQVLVALGVMQYSAPLLERLVSDCEHSRPFSILRPNRCWNNAPLLRAHPRYCTFLSSTWV